MAFDVQTLNDAARCAECLSPNQKQNVLLYLLNGILLNGASGGGVHDLLSASHPDTLPAAVLRGSLIVGNSTPLWSELAIGAAGTVLTSDGADASWTALPGSFTGFANPTASVGLVAVNGVATTAMRSDAAPPIDVTISPTWSGTHTFTASATIIGSAANALNVIQIVPPAALGANMVDLFSDGGPGYNSIRKYFSSPFQVEIASSGGIDFVIDSNNNETGQSVKFLTNALRGGVQTTLFTFLDSGVLVFSPTVAGAVQFNPFGVAAGNTSELRYLELVANGTNYTGFKAPDALAASEIYVLPDAAPAANRFLRAGAVAAGVSTLSWAQVSLTADVSGILPVANGGSGTSTAFTAGSVIFAGAAGVYTEDNANFFYTDATNRLTVNQLALPFTTSATVGGIYSGGSRFIHDFGSAGSYNTFSGRDAGNFTMTGVFNSGFGGQALFSNTTGNSNAAFGLNTLYANTTGNSNVAFGPSALFANTTGIQNFAIGAMSLFANTEGNGNMAVGLSALGANIDGDLNLAIGANALVLNTTGNNNIGIGFQAGDNITTGSSNIVIGYNVDSPTATNSNTLVIGNIIFGTAIDGIGLALSSGNIGIGVITPLAKLHVTNSAAATVATIIKAAASQSANLTEWQSSAAVANTVITAAGNISIPTTTSTVGIMFQGSTRIFHLFGTDNLFLGLSAGNFTLSGINNTGIGANSLQLLTSGNNNTAFGKNALMANAGGSGNTGMGSGVLQVNTSGNNNVAIGNSALLSNTIGENNTAVGGSSILGNTTGSENTVVGFNAFPAANTGDANTSIGAFSMGGNTSGASNVAIGRSALGSNSSGSSNVAIGQSSLVSNTTSDFNIAIGRLSGFVCTGANNIFLGYLAGGNLTTGSNNIVIGYSVNSPAATNSNTLTIGNLIFGAGVDGTGTTLSSGGVGIGVITPTAKLHLRAGTTAASTAPLKFNTGTSMTTAEAGAVEFTTDDLFFTITTGAARKRLLMADATAGLTSGKIPIATTNGRLIDLTASAAYTVSNVTTDRTIDADSTTLDEAVDVLCTLINDLKAINILG